MASSVAPALTLIYQASHDQGQTPDDWKGAFITPLFKKGYESKASNYRLVSYISVSSKVMEHIVHIHILKFLDAERSSQTNNIVSGNEYPVTRENNTVQDLANDLNNHQQIDTILLEFSKMFNRVDTNY